MRSSSLPDYRYIVAVQSIHWSHFIYWRDRIAKSESKHKKILRVAYTKAVQAASYFDNIDDKEKDLVATDLYQLITHQKALDARSFTAGLSFLAAASLAPVLRLEPRLNQIRGDLKQLANCVRTKAGTHFYWKQSRLTRQLAERMRTLINPSFLERIDQPEKGRIEGLKLISDLPLELMRSGDLPLSMRFDTSRIPVLPGNLYLSTCIMPPRILPLSAFREVLVIRSFKSGDPLTKFLERATSIFLEKPAPFSVNATFIDVETEDDFVNALADFEGSILIFDGHGNYDPEIGTGTIVIGGRAVDVWKLRERCTVPPIVILSACDTQPLDGSHSSVATAALTLGARTVLATTLPIDGWLASLFIGRLLYRIAAFLPLAIRYQSMVTWRDFVAGMLRMSYTTEVIGALKKRGGGAYHAIDFDRVQFNANIAINNRQADWFHHVIGDISEQTKLPSPSIQRDIGRWAAMVDSMKYVQIGNSHSTVMDTASIQIPFFGLPITAFNSFQISSE